MTTTDGGNAGIAGANTCPSIHGHKKGHWFSSGLLSNFFVNQYYNK